VVRVAEEEEEEVVVMAAAGGTETAAVDRAEREHGTPTAANAAAGVMTAGSTADKAGTSGPAEVRRVAGTVDVDVAVDVVVDVGEEEAEATLAAEGDATTSEEAAAADGTREATTASARIKQGQCIFTTLREYSLRVCHYY
jgi:hypothetical protein